jgi:ryanodine receptor 2
LFIGNIYILDIVDFAKSNRKNKVRNKEMTDYTPQPLNTSMIQLTEDVEGLIEQLAENAHETWAKKRMKEGWVFGEKRDDKKKHHPCLIPYNELPESEKEYDRSVVSETVKAIVTLGYRIEK